MNCSGTFIRRVAASNVRLGGLRHHSLSLNSFEVPSHLSLNNNQLQVSKFEYSSTWSLWNGLGSLFTNVGNILSDAISLARGTYKPHYRKRKTTHGFLKRLGTNAGRKILQKRRRSGRRDAAC